MSDIQIADPVTRARKSPEHCVGNDGAPTIISPRESAMGGASGSVTPIADHARVARESHKKNVRNGEATTIAPSRASARLPTSGLATNSEIADQVSPARKRLTKSVRDGEEVTTDRPHESALREASPLAATVKDIRLWWRRRQAWHRAEKSLTLQCKAMCRRFFEDGDKTQANRLYEAAVAGDWEHPDALDAYANFGPLHEAREGIKHKREEVEAHLLRLAKLLPVAPWIESVRGVGLKSLASLVGEAGDIGSYRNHACVWKRFGLGVMQDGTRQRLVPGTTQEVAMAIGYNPSRRSVMWNVGACVIKAGGPLKEVYNARKLLELARLGKGPDDKSIIAHRRAQRFMEKRFLKSLYAAWRRAT